MDRDLFAIKLKDSRIWVNLTQKEVATIIGRPQQTIASWETGKGQPDQDTLAALLRLYKVSPNIFFEFTDDDFEITSPEKKHIEKYRTLDGHGKDLVDMILDKEYTRCAEQPLCVAARGGEVVTPSHAIDKRILKEAESSFSSSNILLPAQKKRTQ